MTSFDDFGLDERRERRRLFSLSLPAVLLVSLVVVLPVGWLFWLSISGPDGLTARNYVRLYQSPAYLSIFEQTFAMSAAVTTSVALLGYPVAYLLSQLPRRAATFCLALVLLPFWTSLLVRTFAWLVLLQRNGIINKALIDLGVISEPLSLLYNMTGTYIGMVHIMLPFLILPLYASMRTVDASLTQAAMSLGSTPARAFLGIFLPLSMPGLLGGALLVFVYCLGFYIVPQVLGGGRVNMVAMKVLDNATQFGDWGAASALGVVLLVVVGILFALLAQLSRVAALVGTP